MFCKVEKTPPGVAAVICFFFLLFVGIHPLSALTDDFELGETAFKAENYDKAFRLFEPLARKGHYMAQNRLGMMYRDGKGVSKDLVKAYAWWHLAAAVEDPHWPMARLGRNEIAEELTRKQIAEGQKLARKYAKKIHKDWVSLLTKMEIEMEEEEKRKMSLVESVFRLGDNFEQVQTLISGGANIDEKGRGGHTALSIAVEIDKHKIAKFLIDSGADVNSVNNNGFTPLFIATTKSLYICSLRNITKWYPSTDDDDFKKRRGSYTRSQVESFEIVQALILNGADVKVKTKFKPVPFKSRKSNPSEEEREIEGLSLFFDDAYPIAEKTEFEVTPLDNIVATANCLYKLRDIWSPFVDEAIKWYSLAAKHGDIRSQKAIKEIMSGNKE